jgi:hypothetical protein
MEPYCIFLFSFPQFGALLEMTSGIDRTIPRKARQCHLWQMYSITRRTHIFRSEIEEKKGGEGKYGERQRKK